VRASSFPVGNDEDPEGSIHQMKKIYYIFKEERRERKRRKERKKKGLKPSPKSKLLQISNKRKKQKQIHLIKKHYL
jgi:peptide subunit release factor RF-3